MSSSAAAPIIAQYVVVRADLMKKLGWNVGSVVAQVLLTLSGPQMSNSCQMSIFQAVHASVASMHLHYNEDVTQKYLKDLDGMTTVVLEVPNESQLLKLSERLKEASVDHKVWVEQPEDYPTCLATKPYAKEEVNHLFKKCQLFRGPKLAVAEPKKEAETVKE